MAKYGLTIYGATTYGELSSSEVSYNANLRVSQIDYRTNVLNWDTVSAGSGEFKITHWKIVKNAGGTPDNPNDAIYVYGESVLSGTTVQTINAGTYTDYDEVFPSGIEVTYSFWAFNGLDWVLCGSARTFSVDDDSDTTLKLMQLLPNAWVSSGIAQADAMSYPETGTDLHKFMSGFGFYVDKLRSQISTVANSSDYRYYPSTMLPVAVTDIGFDYEPALGDNYHRALYKNGNLINSLKGSYLGLKLYVSSLTHLAPQIIQGSNLFLDYNHSSFEETSIGWTASTGDTIAAKLFANTVTDVGEAVAAPNTTNTSNGTTDPHIALAAPVKDSGYGLVTNSTGTSIDLYSYGTSPITFGIPVTPGESYQFYGYARSRSSNTSTSPSITATIQWFDLNGSVTSTTPVAGTSVSLPRDELWRYFESSNVDTSVVAPSDAVYAGVKITISSISSGAADKFLLDKLYFGTFPGAVGNMSYGAGESIYEDARTVKVLLEGERVNYVPNPGFYNGVGGWVTYNCSNFITDSTYSLFGTTSGKFTASSSNSALVSKWLTLKTNTYYTFSIYVLGPAKVAKVGVEFSTPLTAVDQISISSDGYYNSTEHVAESDTVTLNGTTFTRISVTILSPEATADSNTSLAKVYVKFPTSAANDVYWVDGAMLEEGNVLKPYFQGNGGPTIAIGSGFATPNDTSTPYIIDPNINFDPLTEVFVHGNSSGTNIVTDPDTGWETRTRVNMIVNPSFESATMTSWSASGCTLDRAYAP